MFDRLTTPEEIFSDKLGSALTMERDVLAMLADLTDDARRPELKQLLAEHAEETRLQIEVVEQCFALLGEKVDASPSPVTKAFAVEAKAALKKTDDTLADAVVLAGALEVAHHEQAVYETLVIHARARGALPVATLLETSLATERSAAAKVKAMAERIAVSGVAVPSERMGRGAKAGLVAGVAATVGAAAVAAASKVGERKAETAVTEAATASPRHDGPVGAHVADTGTVVEPTPAASTAADTGTEEFNDDALQERIAESEHRARP